VGCLSNVEGVPRFVRATQTKAHPDAINVKGFKSHKSRFFGFRWEKNFRVSQSGAELEIFAIVFVFFLFCFVLNRKTSP